jgi:hypothetical protein
VFRFSQAAGMDFVEIDNQMLGHAFYVSYLDCKERRRIGPFTDSLRDRRVIAFLPEETHLIKLEFADGLSDPDFYYLLGKVTLTEEELVTLCQSLEQFSPDIPDFKSSRKRVKRHPDDEEYREIEALSKNKRPKTVH